MAVNWFEGGRRITKLCMAIAALIGGCVAFFEADEPKLEFYTASPLDQWHLRVPAEPSEPADACSPSQTLWAYEIKPSMQRDVRLCFDPSGKSDTEIADEMAKDEFFLTEARKEGYSDGEIIDYLFMTLRVEEDSKRLKQIQLEASRAISFGNNRDADILTEEAEWLRTKIDEAKGAIKNISTAPSEGGAWWNVRIADFNITPAVLAKIEKELPRIEREAFIDHVIEVSSITAYFIGGFWIFSFVIGWIVRGFAGIPRGQDFRIAA